PATLIVGVTCTSIDRAVPTTRALVAIRPSAPITNPDARAVGVHSVTTLACHGATTIDASTSAGATAGVPGAAAVISALSVVNCNTASRPPEISMICVQPYALPLNATGISDSTV